MLFILRHSEGSDFSFCQINCFFLTGIMTNDITQVTTMIGSIFLRCFETVEYEILVCLPYLLNLLIQTRG